jgi:ABC-type nitrate/sulfonate/bicarbonate transport system substrate-binding protein
VEPVLLRGSGQTSQAMVSGSLFASSVAQPAVMLADLNGADLVNVAHGVAALGSRLMVKPEIRKLEDLKGKKIGISSLGSAGDLLFGYVLRKYGIDALENYPPLRLISFRSFSQRSSSFSYLSVTIPWSGRQR